MSAADQNNWRQAAERVLELLREGPASVAFEYLDSLTPAGSEVLGGCPPGFRPGFREVAGHLYWQCQALPECVVISHEIIRRLDVALQAARDAGQTEPDERLVRPLGGTCYNLASFAWPGWAEPGVTVGAPELAAGRVAAQRCLEIRRHPAHSAFQFGYSPSMAHWMYGAYHFDEGDWRGAREQFLEAARLNREAGADDALEAGYASLACLLERPDAPEAQADFQHVIALLQARADRTDPVAENAAFFRDQLLTAQRVYSSGNRPEPR